MEGGEGSRVGPIWGRSAPPLGQPVSPLDPIKTAEALTLLTHSLA
jgi:hypothetical protein